MNRRTKLLLGKLLVAGFLVSSAVSLHAQGTLADYKRAAIFQNMDALTSRLELVPNWIRSGDRFWYIDRDQQRKTFVVVDPDLNTQGPAFDHVRLAAGLSRAAGQSYSATALPFDRFEYRDSGNEIAFSVGEAGWQCELKTYGCAAVPAPFRKGDTLSPDGRWAVFVRDDNLWVRNVISGQARALSTDGQVDNSYALFERSLSRTIVGAPAAARIEFSPDSTKVLGYRTDVRKVRKLPLIETVMGGAPRLHTYPLPLAGDDALPQIHVVLFDLKTAVAVAADNPPFAQSLLLEATACWNADATEACFNEEERGYKTAKLRVANAATGKTRTLIVEKSETYIRPWYTARFAGKDIIWMSERDGWNHLYRIDDETGRVRHQITHGAWAVSEIKHVDSTKKRLYFTAGGREAGVDPYYRILYCVNLDGSGLKRLTPEDSDHTIAFSPTGRYFIDTFSRIDIPPVSVLRAADGSLIRQLQQADISRLKAAGWRAPEPFNVKAADGVTDIYGAIYRPSNFDPSKHYPVLDSIYPGPQVIRTVKLFGPRTSEWNESPLAELGFIVVTIDGRGTPGRSKAFRDYSYGKLESAGGLEDHVAGLRQLAERYPYMNLDQVGIYGHSGGGYATVRAMLTYPDFFKVGVASAGNHDQRSYIAPWSERYQGYPVGDNYLSQANPPLAAKLKGKLLLAAGTLDDNVPPDNTMQMVNALVAANKDFDLLLLPNRNHGFNDLTKNAPGFDLYFLRRRWDFFVKNLMGITPPAEFELEQIKESK